MASSLAGGELGDERSAAFLRAAFRASNPVRFEAPPYQFATAGELPVVVVRKDEPKTGSEDYWQRLGASGARLNGMNATTVVAVYVSQDQRVLNEQSRWVAEWKTTDRQTRQSTGFESERRRRLLDVVAPRRAGYEWSASAAGRRPYVRIALFNGLDADIRGVILALDLIDDKGRAVASGRLRHDPPFAIAPSVEAILNIDVGNETALGNRVFQEVASRLRVAVRVENVVLGGGGMLVPPIASDSAEAARRDAAVASLETRLRIARDNLVVYRQLFGES